MASENEGVSVPCKLSASLLPNNLTGNGTYLAYAHKNKVQIIKGKHGGLIGGSATAVKSTLEEEDTVTCLRYVRLSTVAGGSALAVVTSSGQLHLYDSESRIITTLRSPNTQAFQGVTSDGVSTIYLGCEDGSISVLSLSHNKLTPTMSLSEHKEAITDLCTVHNHLSSSGAGTRLCSADQRGSVIIWDLQHSAHATKLFEFEGTGEPCTSLALCGNWCIAGYSSGHIRLFNVVKGDLQLELAAHSRSINAIHIRSEANLMASCAEDCTVHVFQLPKGDDISEFKCLQSSVVKCMVLTGLQFCGDDHSLLAVSSYDSSALRVFKTT